jgi:hypothetical protein
MPTRYTVLFVAPFLLAISIAVYAALWGNNPARGPESARATDPSNLQYGYLDQDSGMFVSIQLSTLHEDAGRMTIAVPGVGLFVPVGAADLTVNGNGTTSFEYTGAARLDADATLDPVYGVFLSPSGNSTEVQVEIAGEASSDYIGATITVEYDNNTYVLEATAAAHDATGAASDFLQEVVDGDWAAAYAFFESAFQAKVTEQDFVAAASAGIASGDDVTGFSVRPETWIYSGEPGSGPHTAYGWVTLEVEEGSTPSSHLMLIAMVEEERDWRVITMDDTDLITISASAMNGWGFLQETATASGSLVSGPETAPSGAGSAQIALGSTGGGIYGTQLFAGTRLDELRAINYSTYQTSANPGTAQTIALQFDMDYDLTDGTTSWQGRLVYEPYFTETVSKGVWQTWEPLDGEWWATGSPGNSECPQSNPCTWAEVLAEFPNAGLRASVGSLSFKAGSGWPSGWQGNLDAFVIVVGEEAHAFDFEP